MLPKLTFDYSTQTYNVPAEWVDWDWINDFSNYPDPEHEIFAAEYDWEYRYQSGVLSRYIRSLEGGTTSCTSKNKVQYNRTTIAKPYTYYFFALAAVELINNPSLYREARAASINGAFVVNYANSIDMSSLTTVVRKKSGKHLINTEFGALIARVFNATSGVRTEHALRIEPREDRKSLCPHCNAVYELLSKKYWLPNHPDYEKNAESFIRKLEYIHDRNAEG